MTAKTLLVTEPRNAEDHRVGILTIGEEAKGRSLAANLACLGAPICYGFAGLYLRRFVAGLPYDSLTLAATQLVPAPLIVGIPAPL